LGDQRSFAALGGTLRREVHQLLLQSLILGARWLRFGATQLQISAGIFILMRNFVHLINQSHFFFMPDKPIGVR
jgi:hypothetical protein